nr:ribonuclease H-like domain-containing protein [Tanacetum cinerariifolium]
MELIPPPMLLLEIPQDYDASSATPCLFIHSIYVMYCPYIRSLSVMLSRISFHVLYGSYEVDKYIHSSTNETTSSTLAPLTWEELKVDKIVLSWILTTISDALQARLVMARSKSAKEAWTLISDIVEDNKRSRTNALKTELRSIKLGDQTMESYFQKNESLVTILMSLGSHINDEDVPGTYRRPPSPQVKSWRPCFNFAKGSCRFGQDCIYVHDPNAKKNALASSSSISGPTGSAQQITGIAGQETILPNAFAARTLHDPTTGVWNMDTVFPYGTQTPPKAPTYAYLDDTYDLKPPPPINSHTKHVAPTSPNNTSPTPPLTTTRLQPDVVQTHSQPTVQTLAHPPSPPHKQQASNSTPSTPTTTSIVAHQQQPAQTPTPTAQHTNQPFIIPDPPTNPNPVSVHLMVTRYRVRTNRPNSRLNFHVSLVSPLPRSYREAFNDSSWQTSMRDEYHVLIKNKTWTLLLRPTDTNIVRCMWLFRHKYHADGTLSRYKARLVKNGSTQLKGMFLSQKKNAIEILERAHMVNCNPSQTPIDTKSKLRSDGDPISDPTLYQSLEGSLQYLSFTRLNLSYAAQQVCLHMHDPREPHFSALKWILHYVYGTLEYGLQLFSSSTTDLVAYSDANWAGCPTTRRSTSGYCVFLGNNLLSWSSKRHLTLSRSSAEAEYHGVTNAVVETCWLRNLLRKLHTPLSSATIVYCDNVNAVYLSCNLVQHQRTKHIKIGIHFFQDLVAACHVRVLHVLTHYQFAYLH